MIIHNFKIHFKLVAIFFYLFINCALFAQDTLSFLHITDLHTIFNQNNYRTELMDHRNKKMYYKGVNNLMQFLEIVPKKTNSDMVIATGDLIDFFQAQTSDYKMFAFQVEQFSQLINSYYVPAFLTLGNHDIFSFEWKNDNLRHDQNFAERAKAMWIKNLCCFKDGTYYSKAFQVGNTKYRFIFLDDSFYQFSPEDKKEVPYIDKPQLYWLNNQLNESKNDVLIVFMHIPFKNPFISPECVNDLYCLLSKTPSVRLIFGGHYHANEIDHFVSNDGKDLIQVLTGALVQNLENWRLVRLTESSILISQPGKVENEIVINLK